MSAAVNSRRRSQAQITAVSNLSIVEGGAKLDEQQANASESQMPGAPAPDEAPPISDEIVATASEGLDPRAQAGKRVLILGGGIAGLVAAFELKRQGHDPLILEAQHRVGGRVQTLRDFAPGLYAEAGAMRIPRVHDLTLAYCDLFGLALRPFVMGNPQHARPHRRPAHDRGGGRPRA